MRHTVQTLALSLTFLAAGTLAIEAVSDHARRRPKPGSAVRLSSGGPGIPDPVRDGLRRSFGGR